MSFRSCHAFLCFGRFPADRAAMASGTSASSLTKDKLEQAAAATYNTAELSKAERVAKRFNMSDVPLESQMQLACAMKALLGNDGGRVSQKLFDTWVPQTSRHSCNRALRSSGRFCFAALGALLIDYSH